jgi:hypothetical protein
MTRLPDAAPPWIAFPDIKADEFSQYVKQGATEVWFDQVWLPFWSSLSAQEKRSYLKQYQASPEWSAAIRFVCDGGETVDMAEDARESEVHLREWRESRRAKPSWLKRFFGRG